MVILFWLTALLMLGASVFLALSPGPLGLRIAIPALFLLSSDLMLWTLYGTRYLLTDAGLNVRCGPFRWSVAYDDIEHSDPIPAGGPRVLARSAAGRVQGLIGRADDLARAQIRFPRRHGGLEPVVPAAR
jgi:hypothetical protein